MDSNKKELLVKENLSDNLTKGKKGLLGVVFGRTGVVTLIVLIQIGILLIGFQILNQYIFAAYGATILLGFVLVLHIISSEGSPDFKLAWIVPILVLPVFGALFYLFLSMQWETRRLSRQVMNEDAASASALEQDPEVLERLREASVQMDRLSSYVCQTSRSAVYQQTASTYYSSGEAVLDTMLGELKKAKRFIFLEYFIVSPGFMWDSVLNILKEKAKEGVEVRFLYDGMCDIFQFPKDYPKELEKYGIQCKVFLPIVPALSTVQNNRDHRKILVIDGEIAFTGGINLADEYINRKERFGYWKDAAIMFRGDAARSFTLMFLRMWTVVSRVTFPEDYTRYLTTQVSVEGDGFVMPYSDNPLDNEQVGELVYMDILNTATKYVHIMTPYLVLDHEMIVALTYAAKRGVDVKIIMPHIPDKKYAFILARTYYNELLKAGVQIYEFLPGFVHSKLFVSDDEKAVVGSINLDYRSLYLSFECAAMLYRSRTVLDIEADFEETLKQCMQVTTDICAKEAMHIRLAGKILRFLAPLM
ncbi:MAG: cardiolipin synthase [Eubacteriales bacterium]|nr:cardiolipin synthase [Eubacteriales bacterium]